MKIDTSADTAKEPHPEGTWAARVVGSQTKQTKTGRPMIVLSFKTSKGIITSYNTYVDQYPHLFLEPMYSLGFEKAYFDDFEFEDLADECLKRRAMIVVEHEQYMGRPTASVAKILPLEEADAKPKKASAPAADDDDGEPF